jgi:hypothetical protein
MHSALRNGGFGIHVPQYLTGVLRSMRVLASALLFAAILGAQGEGDDTL